MEIVKTKHFKEMLIERNIKESWVDFVIEHSEKIENKNDGTKHLLSKIKEYENRWLRIIINTKTNPNKAITVFFDRRIKEYI